MARYHTSKKRKRRKTHLRIIGTIICLLIIVAGFGFAGGKGKVHIYTNQVVCGNKTCPGNQSVIKNDTKNAMSVKVKKSWKTSSVGNNGSEMKTMRLKPGEKKILGCTKDCTTSTEVVHFSWKIVSSQVVPKKK